MTPIEPINQLLRRLWRHLAPRRRIQFALLLALMLVASLAEMVSIGTVLPFLGVVTAPSSVFLHPVAQPLVRSLEISTPEQLLLPLTLIFGLAALISGAIRLQLLWVSTRLSFATGADLSIGMYRRTLYQPYAVHVARNSSEVINGITNKAGGTIYVILNVITLISALLMLTVILLTLIVVDPVIALMAFGGFGLIYSIIIKFTGKRLLLDGKRVSHESTQVIKSLQEGLGGIRDVLIDGSQEAYCQIYQVADYKLRHAQGNNVFIGQSPRYGIESAGMILIAALAYSLALQPDGISKAIPILGALALGAQRLLPIMQQAFSAWTNIRAGQASLQDAIELLDQPLPNYADVTTIEPIQFEKSIELRNVGFRYDEQTPWVLKNINLSIAKGSRVGFIGQTGCGKSTLLDIVMGLLLPTEGIIEIDGRSITEANCRAWQAHIAHVPQTIFLSDSSIAENIAFGVPKDMIDNDRVLQAARLAQMSEIIESWPQQYKTVVGERGVRLSGGQRQRIGIARALYKNADVIIFDEATSALDEETERLVMRSIESLATGITILIIAHRLTTLSKCSQIVELGDCGMKRITKTSGPDAVQVA